MVNYPHNVLFNRGDTDRQLRIDFSGGTITNKEMHQGSFTLTESLCSEERLTFGTCESSVLSFKVHNVLTPLAGQELTVYEVLNGNTAEPFNYGKYKVHSDKPTADRRYRDVVAYDAMYDILNADVASWYNSLTFPCSIGYFRKKFLSYLKVDYVDTELVNDGIYIQKTVEVEQLSGKQVINAICEINGCFGHINRQGKFDFVVLKQFLPGLYPSETLYPSEGLYPKKSNSAELFPSSKYSACKYEDFKTKLITGVQIRQEEDDIGATVGTTANVYVVEDNFLVYGKSHDELTEIANNMLSVINNIYYRPIDYVKTNGKPYLEVGDNISVGSSEVIIETYILERTIRAINGQKDEFSAKGVESHPKQVNGLNKQIIQLKGKTNKLTRTVDETKSEIKDVKEGLTSTIIQTASQIQTELENTKDGLESSIEQTANQIRSEVSDTNSNLQSQITQNAGSITSEINRATNAENSLSTRITQTDEKIRSDVAATYETIKVVEEKVKGAETASTNYTNTRLALYSTTEQMNSAIEQKADSITSTVNGQIEETVQYIDTKAATAESNANANTSNLLKSYSTTTQMNSAIEQKGNSITASVTSQILETKQYAYGVSQDAYTSAVNATDAKLQSYSTTKEIRSFIKDSEQGITLAYEEKIEETKTYSRTLATNALAQSVIKTDEKLESYSTTVEVQSKIDASKDGILLSVSETYETISNAGKEYEKLQSSIDLNASNISLKVSSGDVQTMINASLDSLVLTSSQIRLEGYTTINGGFSVDASGNAVISDSSGSARMYGGFLLVSSNGYPGVYIGEGEVSCTKINGGTPISSANIYSYLVGYATNSEINSIISRIEDIENLLSGGSWTYLQLEGYDGDEYAYSYFTK